MPDHWFSQFFSPDAGANAHLQPLRRLRTSVLVFYAIALTIAVTAVAWLSYSDYQETLRNTERQSLSLVRSLDEQVSGSFMSVEQAMQSVAEDVRHAGGVVEVNEAWIHARLRTNVELAPQIHGIFLLDAKGILRANGLDYPTRQLDLSKRNYFLWHRDHTETTLHIGDPLISRLDYAWKIPLSRRINTANGDFGGVMLASVDPSYYLKYYDSLKLEKGTRIQVLRADGTLLLSYPLDITRLGQVVSTQLDARGSDKQGSPEPFFRSRDDRLGDHFIAQLPSAGNAPLIVRVTLDADRVLQRYLLNTHLRVLTATAIMLVLSLVLYVLLQQIRRVEDSEARLRLTQFAVDESPDMIVWSDQHGIIRYANRRLSDITGHAASELATLPLGELFGANSHDWAVLEAGLGTGDTPGIIETTLRDRHGQTLPIELSAARMSNENASYLCITARDISERRRAQEEIRRHRDHLQDMVNERTAEIRAVLDANPLAIALAVNGRIELINPAFEALFGHDRQSVRHLDQGALYASRTGFSEFVEALHKGLKPGGTFRDEAELKRRDGSTFWAVLFARSLVDHEPERGVVFIIEDVTAQRSAALNLRQSEQLKRAVLDTLNDSFALIDADRRFVDVNAALCRQLGLPRSELIGRTPESVWGDTSRRLFPAESLATPGILQQEIMLPVRSGQRHPFQVSYGVIADEHGLPRHRFAFFADISRQKQIASSLIEAKEAAEAASQAKSSFLTNMSHELRTPMHAILSFSEMGLVKSGDAGSADLQRYFERIQGAGKRLLSLLNDLLDLSRLEADRMRYDKHLNSLQHTVQAALNEVSPLTSAHHLQLLVDETSPRIVARFDRARLTQVLINLLSNAIRFSPPNGRIHISFLADASLPDESPAVGLSVRDEGPGIPVNELDIIFDAFEQGSHAHSGGSGLGLAISQRIMRDHEGLLLATNHPDGGAVFTLLLPAGEGG